MGDVSFSMSTGEVVGLLGPNGAGKTTVFYMVVGFIKPTAGTVALDHQEISGLPMFQRARLGIAYLPQEPSVFRRLSVEDNVRAVLETRADITEKRKRERLDELLEDFGMIVGRLAEEGLHALRGRAPPNGDRARPRPRPQIPPAQRALRGHRPHSGARDQDIVRKLSEAGIGVLITDHNVRDTLDITHRAHIINLGNIVVSGSRDEVLASDMARKIYLGEEFKM